MLRQLFYVFLAFTCIVTPVHFASAQDDDGLSQAWANQVSLMQAFEANECAPELTVSDFTDSDFTCGHITVPESHFDDTKTDTIRLAVVVFHSRSDHPEPDPIILLDGGPGSNTTHNAAFFAWILNPLLENRDLIIFDQRGNGYSEPHLDCPELSSFYQETLAADIATSELWLRADEILAGCNAQWRDKGVDLTVFNSVENAADVVALAQALGYDQVNLYGGSYGTRLGQLVMRDHPSMVRSAVLDSVSSFASQDIIDTYLDIFLNPFAVVFEQCAANADCNNRYPDLENILWTQAAALNEIPVTTTVDSEYTGETETVQLDGYELLDAARSLAFGTDTYSLLPYAIYAAQEGDYSLLADEVVGNAYDTSTSDVSFWAYLCNQGLETMITQAIIDNGREDELNRIYPGTELTTPSMEQCETWGQSDLPDLEEKPLVSDLPALLLAGQFDIISLPVMVKGVAANLPNAFYFEIPYAGHVPSFREACVLDMVAEFFNDPSTEPNAKCLVELSLYFQ